MSYTHPIQHHSMVFDEIRNKFYSDAIKALVTQDSVVMDLGAGLGLHGLIAARAGAKKVYLVEPERVILAAAKVAKENNLSEKIECFQTKIEGLELPQPVDAIISVFTGNFLLQEDLLPSLFYARDKHLAKKGRLIPDQAKMFVQPISSAKLFNEKIGRWAELSQDFNFSVLQMHASNSMYTENYQDTDYTSLASPAEILHMDFMTATCTDCKTSTTIELTDDGLCHGFFGWFDMRLGSHWLSTSPTAEKTHWSQVYLPIDPPVPVLKGQKLIFNLQRPEYGEWSWVIEINGSRQKHSTFLSGPLQPSDLAKKADTYKPVLNKKGQLVREALELFEGNETAGHICQALSYRQEPSFRSETEARHFIAGLIARYG